MTERTVGLLSNSEAWDTIDFLMSLNIGGWILNTASVTLAVRSTRRAFGTSKAWLQVSRLHSSSQATTFRRGLRDTKTHNNKTSISTDTQNP
jgi:hypothetical protein